MKVGDVVLVSSLQVHFINREVRGTIGYTANEPLGRGKKRKDEDKRVFLMLFLGSDWLVPRENEPTLDPSVVLQLLGWTPPPKNGQLAITQELFDGLLAAGWQAPEGAMPSSIASED